MSEENIKLTVAICTHNRGHLLEPLINSLLIQYRINPINILVVDNSTTPEDKHAAEILSDINHVDVIFSYPPGLSNARNTAIKHCGTEIIAFIDDDAFPINNWSEEVYKPFENPNVGFVAGPIIPIWPEQGKPDWIPENYIGCLSVLDLGPADKILEKHEYAYGANMAFRLSALQNTDGFNVSLGRTGNKTLLSNEEIDVQDSIRKQGYSGFYSCDAAVHHMVEENRLSRHWFLSRMAWQSVSIAYQNNNINQKKMLSELQMAADKCGLGSVPSALLNEFDPDKFGNHLNFVRLLFSYLLQANLMKDDVNYTSTHIQKASELKNNNQMEDYILSAAVPLNTKYLFYDSRPGHHYLYNLYGEVPDSELIISELNQWEMQDGKDMNFIKHSIIPNIKAVIFLTLDPYIYGPNFDHFYRMVKHQSTLRKIFGILHRAPDNAQQIEHLTRTTPYIRFIVLSESLMNRINELSHTRNTCFLPHHAVLEHFFVKKESARKRHKLPDDRIIISMLGEIREGKGINRLIDSLAYFPDDLKEKVLFLVVGNAKDVDPTEITKLFKKHGIPARIISEHVTNNYKLVTDPELAEYVSASDIGLLLFEKSQKSCMSGIMPNYIMNDIPIISSHNSIVGEFILDNDIGWTTDISDPKKLADTISDAVNNITSNNTNGLGFNRIKQSISSAFVIDRLKSFLNA